MDTTSHIRILLLEIGIPANLLGFTYIIYAIQLALENVEYNYRMTKELYIEVAQRFGASRQNVERSMRNAIAIAIEYGKPDFIEQIFGNSINPKKGVPTNSQFITSVCLYMIERQLLEHDIDH